MAAELFLSIALLLVVAKVFGYVTNRYTGSSILGEILAGVALGPVLHLVAPNDLLKQFADFGIILLLFLIGLSTHFDEIKGDMYSASFLAAGGSILSFIVGFGAGMVMFGSLNTAIVLGLVLLSSSTAVAVKSFMDIGEFKTRIYKMIVGMSMADDAISIMALALFTSFIAHGAVDIWRAVGVFFVVIGFFFAITSFGSKLAGRIMSISTTVRDEYFVVALSLVILFAVAFISENVGIAAVTGAFLAGITMSRSNLTEPIIIPKIKVIGYSFFIPLFFAYSAIIMNLGSIAAALPFVIIITALAVVTKIVGSGLMATYYNYKRRDQLLLGIGMVPRGDFAILIAQVALGAALITVDVYSTLLSIIVLTVLSMVVLMRVARAYVR